MKSTCKPKITSCIAVKACNMATKSVSKPSLYRIKSENPKIAVYLLSLSFNCTLLCLAVLPMYTNHNSRKDQHGF